MNASPAPIWILSVPVSDPGKVSPFKVWLEDACDAAPVEIEIADKSTVWLESYFEEETEARLMADVFRNAFPESEPQIRLCAPKDWTTFWQHHFKPRRIGDHFMVVPEWMREEVDPGDRIPIWIQPGLSFGTGDHFTTRYCLEALDRFHTEGGHPVRMLDAGCGSAILSIGARKLGWTDILAVDFDEVAIGQAKENLERNGIEDGITLQPMDLTRTWPAETYPLVVANLYGGLLMDLAPRLVRACTGRLILSGIRAVEADAVSTVYAQLGVRELRSESDHEWCGMTLECGSRRT